MLQFEIDDLVWVKSPLDQGLNPNHADAGGQLACLCPTRIVRKYCDESINPHQYIYTIQSVKNIDLFWNTYASSIMHAGPKWDMVYPLSKPTYYTDIMLKAKTTKEILEDIFYEDLEV